MKQRIILFIAIAAGLFAAFLTRQYMVGKDREVKRELAQLRNRYRRISVVTVTRDLPAGSVIQSADIGAAALPKLVDQAVAANSAAIDGASGASMTSEGFRQAVAMALELAK